MGYDKSNNLRVKRGMRIPFPYLCPKLVKHRYSNIKLCLRDAEIFLRGWVNISLR